MTDSVLTVEREENAAGGRYFIRIEPGVEAEMTFRKGAPGVITVDHTFTPRAYRGRNIAQQLMDRLIADARTEGTRFVPLCSYAVAQFRSHPEWADLLAD